MKNKVLGRRIYSILTLSMAIVILLATPAAAHTGFESSTPADGDTITEPLSEISLVFAGEAEPAGEGFVLLDADGSVRVPDEIVSSDNLTWTLRFNEPLQNGIIGVRWKVAAPDAHPIEGSFSFTIDAPIATTTTARDTTTSEAPPAIAETTAIEDDISTEPSDETTTTASVDESSVAASIDLADFLDTDETAASGVIQIGAAGRASSLLGFVVAFGGIAFAALALRGDRSDIRAVLFWVRRGAVASVIGAGIEAAAQVATLAGSWSGLWSITGIFEALFTSFGISILLRVTGGMLVGGGAQLATHSAVVAADPVASVKQLAYAGTGSSYDPIAGDQPQAAPAILHDGDDAWHIEKSPGAFLGAALLALSYLFDGHTASEGPRWLHALANTIHVTTAATWAGGVIMLAYVIARRHRRNADTRALQLAVRFSVVATIALIGAAIAGVALSVVILDAISEIWTTSWGQLLVLKVVLVAIAGAGGGYNHKVVIPALERFPDNQEVAHRFRSIVTLEAIALIAVTLVTVFLIAASST